MICYSQNIFRSLVNISADATRDYGRTSKNQVGPSLAADLSPDLTQLTQDAIGEITVWSLSMLQKPS